jgi:crotonobetainyl-CoA:carnitine CoA-transferase CaiB-like acyl-CoA transferase
LMADASAPRTALSGLWVVELRSGVAPGFAGPLALFLDAGKARVEPNLETTEGRAGLRELVSRCDLLVHDLDPAQLERVGLAIDETRAMHPELVEVALLPFGVEEPYATYAATSIVLLALGGYQYLTGETGREPLMLPGFQPEYLTAFYGIIAGLSGLLARMNGDRGRWFEITSIETLASLH